MLKALELIGFKSFADRTRFEFAPGITVVVGPNGSGKSNVVDAIKWVLGEQSAKSLRGREMADVIFQGSGSGRRKPANAAEATLYFDNSDRRLAWDADEVSVTRRIYRSGEGEYLINGQPCRLRDVRDLFRGTGLGTDAYSLIEQGKVDLLLQASPRDRRAIFEEAAGISRFKMKKVETQRRLLRVDENLMRLSDIVEEVETRLRSVRAQSAKARRYQEYTERLKQLRTETGRVDWRRLTGEIEAHQRALAELAVLQEEDSQRLAEAQQTHHDADVGVTDHSESVRRHEADWIQAHARVEAARQRGQREAERVDELAQELVRLTTRLRDARSRAAELAARLAECAAGVAQAEESYSAIRQGLARQQAELDQLTEQLEEARAKYDRTREAQADRLRAAAVIGNRVSALETELRGIGDRRQLAQQRHQRHADELAELQQLLRDRERAEQELAEHAAVATEELGRARQGLLDQQAESERLQEHLSELRARRTAAMERSKVLSELEHKQEGVGAGARDVLLRAKRDRFGPFREVVGMVADLVHVRVEMASMIDAALGPLAQCVVVDGTQLLDHLTNNEYLPPGRVGLIFAEHVPPAVAIEPSELERLPGVLGRADRFVTADDQYLELIHGLLRGTWFAESLADAWQLRQEGWNQVRWVTRAGDVVDVDGSVAVGPRHAVGGLVSRRSELSELRRVLDQLDSESTSVARLQEAVRAELTRLQDELAQLGQRHDTAAAEYTRATIELQGLRQRRAGILADQSELAAEIESIAARQATLEAQRDELAVEQAAMDEQLRELDQQLAAEQERIEQLEHQHREFLQSTTQTRVEMAKSEQLLEALAGQMQACKAEQEERRQAERELVEQWARTDAGRSSTELVVLAATAEIAEQTSRLEQLGELVDAVRGHLAAATTERERWARELDQLRSRIAQRSQQRHECELAMSGCEAERANLARRVMEDYGFDLAEIASRTAEEAQGGAGEQGEQGDVDQEIEELRRKLNQMGAVNMEAISELEELEQRFGGLSSQYADLVETKETLERIIQRINRESRRLFQETLEAIRANFRQLFRRVFGGGSADIVLEEGVDILEAGIDIVATPPGKQAMSISLLSGGERALTAVTLLLGIFQHRPSPFCVLDEVDGPLDEANIGRFVEVLRDFLQWTRFVVVTHSKKTMAAASTLYGVTMQESGVSKRVSVRFDDITEDGHIRGREDGGESLLDAG